ncbi:MAG TPA: TetR/AcrR family transcriptional regulator [Phototrophicaceae bacterium]|nr:TetR/AcrR family transcriptional regulator [Phototrophicaceae bacterium]
MTPKIADAIQEQLIKARRDQILDAATTVFAQRGFHRATIRDVAKEAGIADGTIYNYFENKTAVLLGILERLNQSEKREEDMELGTHMDFRVFMRLYMRQRYEFITQNGVEVFQILMSEVLVNKELSQLYYQQVIEPNYRLMEKYMQVWIERGALKPFDVKLWMRTAAGMTVGLLMLRIMGDPELQDRWDDLPDLIVDTMLNGLARMQEDKS